MSNKRPPDSDISPETKRIKEGKAEKEEEKPQAEKSDEIGFDDADDCSPVPDDEDDFTDIQNEKDVGITEFISKHDGFSGIIKQRYSDFVVNEILPNGQVVSLTDLACPAESVDETPPVNILDKEKQQELGRLMSDGDCQQVVIDVTGMSKEDRRKIHENVRRHYPGLESKTENSEEKMLIIVFKSKQAGSRGARQFWPPNRGNFTRFVMYKENKDTMEAINMLAGLLNMKPSCFTYAGTKDKRAKTSQMVSVYRMPAKRIIALNAKLKNVAFGNFTYEEKPVQLGHLAGNRFKIVLRNISGSDDEIRKGVESLKEYGFINYYGMQRFGTTTVPTQAIGRALIQGKWQEAIELIMRPRKGEDVHMSECRKLWWETRDAKATFEKLRRRNSIEGHLLRGLMAHRQNDFVSALNSIPRNVRLMYIHSYQSYIWNQVVSWRLKKFGLRPMEGDLYSPGSESAADIRAQEKTPPQTLTAEKLASEDVSIYNVVLPLPGHAIKLPQNEVGEMYKEILAKDGMDMDTFRCKVKTYALSGSYRHIVVKPNSVSWSIDYYNDPTEQLVLSDLDIVNNVSIPKREEGKFKALILEFSLPPSSYATMALREILKMDTSAQAQKLLT